MSVITRWWVCTKIGTEGNRWSSSWSKWAAYVKLPIDSSCRGHAWPPNIRCRPTGLSLPEKPSDNLSRCLISAKVAHLDTSHCFLVRTKSFGWYPYSFSSLVAKLPSKTTISNELHIYIRYRSSRRLMRIALPVSSNRLRNVAAQIYLFYSTVSLCPLYPHIISRW